MLDVSLHTITVFLYKRINMNVLFIKGYNMFYSFEKVSKNAKISPKKFDHFGN